MQFFFGMFLADFQNHAPITNWGNARVWTRRYLAPLLIVIGFYLASYPEDKVEWAGWSMGLDAFSKYILPPTHDHARFFTAFGVEFMCMGIHFSPQCKDLLSSKYLLWLGKNSFAVYLIHGALVRSILTWMLYGIALPAMVKNDRDEMVPGPPLRVAGPLRSAFCLPIWFVIMYAVANLWTRYVDPVCARWTGMLERYVFVDTEKPEYEVLLK